GNLDAEGKLKDFDVAGNLMLSVGDTKDANGNWRDGNSRVNIALSQGAVKLQDGQWKILDTPGTSLQVLVTGNFNIGPVEFAADNLSVAVKTVPNPTTGKAEAILEISGTVLLKNFRNAMVTLGDGGQAGGLKINLSTGQWELDGFRIVLPKFLMFDAVTLGWSYK